MIFFIVSVCWVLLATSVPQLTLVAIGTLLRVLYITGDGPNVPKPVILFWSFLVLVCFVMADGVRREEILIFLCSVLLLGILILHVGQQVSNAGLARRIPAVRQVALFGGRALVLLKRSASDMLFYSKQNVSEIRYRYRDQGVIKKNVMVGHAYLIASRRVAICLLYEGTRLVDRWTAVVSARGEFPSRRLSILAENYSARKWYADLFADLALTMLLVIPAIMSDGELVPPRIIEIFEPFTGLALS
ncbi:MAG: hypothetical protein ACOYLK_03090 [Sphingomonas sp.]